MAPRAANGRRCIPPWARRPSRTYTVKMRRHDKEALEFDITHCRFAEFFRALGEPELGALLICGPISTSPQRAAAK